MLGIWHLPWFFVVTRGTFAIMGFSFRPSVDFGELVDGLAPIYEPCQDREVNEDEWAAIGVDLFQSEQHLSLGESRRLLSDFTSKTNRRLHIESEDFSVVYTSHDRPFMAAKSVGSTTIHACLYNPTTLEGIWRTFKVHVGPEDGQLKPR